MKLFWVEDNKSGRHFAVMASTENAALRKIAREAGDVTFVEDEHTIEEATLGVVEFSVKGKGDAW